MINYGSAFPSLILICSVFPPPKKNLINHKAVNSSLSSTARKGNSFQFFDTHLCMCVSVYVSVMCVCVCVCIYHSNKDTSNIQEAKCIPLVLACNHRHTLSFSYIFRVAGYPNCQTGESSHADKEA